MTLRTASMVVWAVVGGLVGCGGDDDAPVGVDGGGVSSDGGGTSAMDGGAVDVDGGTTMADGGEVGTDGGEPVWPDGGPGVGAPDWAPLTVGPAGSCEPLVPCGGDVVGAWDVSGGCFEVDIESAIARCPGAMVTRREGRGRGRVVFGADGLAHRVAQAEVDVDVFIPAICAAVVSCPMIEAAMRAYVTDATCTENAMMACECTAHQVTRIDDRDGYTIEGNEIVGAVSGHRWQYCIDGDQLTYRDATPAGPTEPGIVELTRR